MTHCTLISRINQLENLNVRVCESPFAVHISAQLPSPGKELLEKARENMEKADIEMCRAGFAKVNEYEHAMHKGFGIILTERVAEYRIKNQGG